MFLMGIPQAPWASAEFWAIRKALYFVHRILKEYCYTIDRRIRQKGSEVYGS